MLTSADVARLGRPLLLLPMGSCEQHGPHLPLDTDARLAGAVAGRLAERCHRIVVAGPTLPYGASGEHAGFPGTVSIGLEAVEHLLVELARSLGPEFGGLVVLSWHGGNAAAVAAAAATIRREGRRILVLTPQIGGDAHAGRTETSMMLAVAPELVRLDLAEAGETRPLAELMPALRKGGVAAVSRNGVLGDPQGASAVEGEEILDSLVADLAVRVDSWEEP
jgi:creatinine amidohydrolase